MKCMSVEATSWLPGSWCVTIRWDCSFQRAYWLHPCQCRAQCLASALQAALEDLFFIQKDLKSEVKRSWINVNLRLLTIISQSWPWAKTIKFSLEWAWSTPSCQTLFWTSDAPERGAKRATNIKQHCQCGCQVNFQSCFRGKITEHKARIYKIHPLLRAGMHIRHLKAWTTTLDLCAWKMVFDHDMPAFDTAMPDQKAYLKSCIAMHLGVGERKVPQRVVSIGFICHTLLVAFQVSMGEYGSNGNQA